MIDNKLEILVITYNRSKELDNTLKQLLSSPFSRCKITILDNCSPDNTPSVCARYEKLFPNFRIVRHKTNIGGDPNYLRAVELSDATYIWILGDDDSYDFSDCDDVFDIIRNENADIICVGYSGQLAWESGFMATSRELVRRGSRYFYIVGFIPNIIFRRSLFDYECLYNAYRNIMNLFPQLVLANKSLENNSSVYIAKNKIVHRDPRNKAGFSPLFHLLAWVNSCQMIKDKKLRRKVIYEIFDNKLIFFKKVVTYIAYAKATRSSNLMKKVTLLALGFSKDQLAMLIVASSILLLPTPFCKLLLNIYRKHTVTGKLLPERPWTDFWI